MGKLEMGVRCCSCIRETGRKGTGTRETNEDNVAGVKARGGESMGVLCSSGEDVL